MVQKSNVNLIYCLEYQIGKKENCTLLVNLSSVMSPSPHCQSVAADGCLSLNLRFLPVQKEVFFFFFLLLTVTK